MTLRPFLFVFSVESRPLGSVGAEMTPRGILNARLSLYAAAPLPPENIICWASKGVCLSFRCDDNPLMCFSAFSFLSFLEWTHLLLSGPHVPLVVADLKAPVQCSPCKKKKKRSNTTLCLLTVLLTGVGQIVFALLVFVLACWTRWVSNQDNSYNVTLSNTDNWTNFNLQVLSADFWRLLYVLPGEPHPSGTSCTLSIKKCFANTLWPASASSTPLYTKCKPMSYQTDDGLQFPRTHFSLFCLTT